MNTDRSSFNVQINVVYNGYMVFPAYNLTRDCGGPSQDTTQVFESFDALVAHLRAHLPIYPVSDPPRTRRSK